MIHGCTTAAHVTLADATAARARIKRLYHASTTCALCEKCDSYHVRVKVGQYPIHVQWKKIIELYAQGHAVSDVAKILGITEHAVERMTTIILSHFYALNRANLVAIAISLGIVDPNLFVPKVEELKHA